MMKRTIKYIVGLLLVLLASGSYAQEQSAKAKPDSLSKWATIKDCFMVEVYTDMWQDLPEGITGRTISQAWNMAYCFNFPLSEKSPFSFGVGLGYTTHNLYSNGLLKRDSVGGSYLEKITNGYDISRVNFGYVTIPIEFRYQHQKSGWKAAVGLRSGMKVGCYTKYQGDNPTNNTSVFGGKATDEVRLRNSKIGGVTKYNFELIARVSWRFIGVNAAYNLTKMFEEDKGPQIYPISLGLSFILF